MKEGSLLIVVPPSKRPRLEYWAREHQRSLRDEATYLVSWAIEALDQLEPEPEPAAA